MRSGKRSLFHDPILLRSSIIQQGDPSSLFLLRSYSYCMSGSGHKSRVAESRPRVRPLRNDWPETPWNLRLLTSLLPEREEETHPFLPTTAHFFLSFSCLTVSSFFPLFLPLFGLFFAHFFGGCRIIITWIHSTQKEEEQLWAWVSETDNKSIRSVSWGGGSLLSRVSYCPSWDDDDDNDYHDPNSSNKEMTGRRKLLSYSLPPLCI